MNVGTESWHEMEVMYICCTVVTYIRVKWHRKQEKMFLLDWIVESLLVAGPENKYIRVHVHSMEITCAKFFCA